MAAPMIKPSERGSLHKAMGVPQGKKIGKPALQAEKAKAKREGNKKLVKKTTFALNMN